MTKRVSPEVPVAVPESLRRFLEPRKVSVPGSRTQIGSGSGQNIGSGETLADTFC